LVLEEARMSLLLFWIVPRESVSDAKNPPHLFVSLMRLPIWRSEVDPIVWTKKRRI